MMTEVQAVLHMAKHGDGTLMAGLRSMIEDMKPHMGTHQERRIYEYLDTKLREAAPDAGESERTQVLDALFTITRAEAAADAGGET